MASPAAAVPSAGSEKPTVSVDAKAELTVLLEQWVQKQQATTEELVSILTKWV